MNPFIGVSILIVSVKKWYLHNFLFNKAWNVFNVWNYRFTKYIFIIDLLSPVIIIICFFYSTEIGVGLAGFGISFLFLGMLLLFDKGLLAIGNVSIKYI